jgi:hypothetical protein
MRRMNLLPDRRFSAAFISVRQNLSLDGEAFNIFDSIEGGVSERAGENLYGCCYL